MTEIAMLHDVVKCTACRGCQVACKQWKNLLADKQPFNGQFQSHDDLGPQTLNLIRMREDYSSGKMNWIFSKFQCMHCGDPACARACPEEALWKTENGPVAHSDEKCVGCGYCVTNCTFGVPRINPVTKKSTKCDLCADRIEKGMVPSCALTCTSDAILFGTRQEMVAIAEKRLAKLKETYPNACLYGVDKNDGIKGTSMLYIFNDKPSVFGFPDEPEVPATIPVWKDVVQPVGKGLMAAAGVAVAAGFVANSVIGVGSKKEDKDHE
ncbi:MAG: 4Fe-4S dicluster domain-containing protein [Deferribacterales bacterium]|nr:4Fe-4S dicluster domain-containing protein [Deferribacterales bacterium]